MSFRPATGLLVPGFLIAVASLVPGSGLLAAQAGPEAGAAQAPRITVQSQLVLVPATVQTRHGDVIYGLKASQFEVTDDGVPQKVKLDDEGDVRPISLVLMVQCSRDAAVEFPKMRGLATMVDALIGGAPSQVAVADFGTEPFLITNFTGNAARRESAVHAIEPCDDEGGAAIFDAVSYANQLFEKAHAKGRRVILLVSETRDHGSHSRPQDTIRELGRSNTVVDAVSFSPGRDAVMADLKGETGASGGLVGLVLMAVQAVRKNAPKEFARLSGGEYINFASQEAFDRDLNSLANRVGNYYLLSFQPKFPAGTSPAAGLHSLEVRIPDYPSAVIRHRASYWGTAPEP
jgi:VWFA-related protein